MLSACAPALQTASCISGKPFTETKLYFGLNKPAGGVVSGRDWQEFVDTDIAPRFPEGFTVVDAQGAWLGRKDGKTVSENSKIVIRLHEAAEEKAVGEIIGSYKKKFAQEAVMRVDAAVCAAFKI
ncbi:MAG: DUF3574 domain-containing protein [Alphaproteobacteria bacterium]|nr:MAG: DUF3574 domain-containing protein [Alphaproteobacteria bacterium]